MLLPALVAFFHFAAVLGMFGTLLGEWLLFSRSPSVAQASRLQQLDRLYGLSAMVLLVAGGLRAWRYEKGLDYYLHNPFFHLKLTAFIVVGLLSVYPTVVFIRWGAALREGRAPVVTPKQHLWITRLLKIELAGVVVILAAASLMAKGVRF
jgi:putative membrane protein